MPAILGSTSLTVLNSSWATSCFVLKEQYHELRMLEPDCSRVLSRDSEIIGCHYGFVGKWKYFGCILHLINFMLNTSLRIYYLPVRKHLLALQVAANVKVLALQNERRTVTGNALAKEEMFSAAAAANVEQGINLAGTGYVYILKLPESIIRPI